MPQIWVCRCGIQAGQQAARVAASSYLFRRSQIIDEMADGQMTDLPAGIGWTALLVARARANESRRPDRLFDDPLAPAFVAAGGRALAAAEQSLPGGNQEEVNRWREDSVALRTWFFDGLLMKACAAGCRQIALLGAGLDARAFRLAWPSGVRLFELDMADVLAFKERVVAKEAATPRCERVPVAVDLRDPAWPDRLREAGLERDQSTAWLLEGLLMYLAESERDRLLDSLGQLASAGSWVGLDHAPGFFAVPNLRGAQLSQRAADQIRDPSC
jgi:methyltransferase (TIGR00027 family)